MPALKTGAGLKAMGSKFITKIKSPNTNVNTIGEEEDTVPLFQRRKANTNNRLARSK